MLERLRNMEPLSGQEEYRIRSRLRNIILLLAGMVLLTSGLLRKRKE